VSQNYPQQPQWGGPQQPMWAPPPPKKRSVGKILGFGCLGIIGLVVVIVVIAAIASSGGSGGSKTSSSSTSSTTATQSAGGKAKVGGSKTAKPADTVVFKVWGTAPAGALGGLDIGYGSDSDTRKGAFKNGKFTASLPLTKGAMFFNVNAQLQGSGDIHCSVTVGGKTKTGHASGGYNICSAQLSSNFTGGWD
jgi:hypothetical protein